MIAIAPSVCGALDQEASKRLVWTELQESIGSVFSEKNSFRPHRLRDSQAIYFQTRV
jgi:hypothetical protein